jgi:uncharacterized protein (DUF2384 family)
MVKNPRSGGCGSRPRSHIACFNSWTVARLALTRCISSSCNLGKRWVGGRLRADIQDRAVLLGQPATRASAAFGASGESSRAALRIVSLSDMQHLCYRDVFLGERTWGENSRAAQRIIVSLTEKQHRCVTVTFFWSKGGHTFRSEKSVGNAHHWMSRPQPQMLPTRLRTFCPFSYVTTASGASAVSEPVKSQ